MLRFQALEQKGSILGRLSVMGAAALLGMPTSTLRHRQKQLDINPTDSIRGEEKTELPDSVRG